MTAKETREHIEALRREASTLNSDLVAEEQRISRLQKELTDKLSRAAQRRLEISNEIAELEQKISAYESEEHVAELFRYAALLDKEGEVPSLLERFLYLCAQLRTDRRLGQSHYSVRLTIDRLRGIEKGYGPLPPELRTWTGLARSWVKVKEAA
jgi:hypothetical protein